MAGECVTSWQHKFFAERVRDEDFYGRLPVATLHEQNKKVPKKSLSYRNAYSSLI
jgi:hypothetical protein